MIATIRAQGSLDPSSETIEFVETWEFDDRQADTLSWRIRKIGKRKYVDEATVKDEAIGEQAGCAVHWSYTRKSPQGSGSSVTLNFVEWFYRMDERVYVVRGSAGRLGLPFLSAYVTYRRLE